MPAIATPPLVASPRFARPHPMKPRMTATTPSKSPPKMVNSAMIAITNAAMPRPFLGAVGGGV